MKKLNKVETKKEIQKFFSDVVVKTPKDVKKIKKLAMKHNIKLGNLRKKFCKKCFSLKLKTINVKNKIKKIKCLDCGYVAKYKLKGEN